MTSERRRRRWHLVPVLIAAVLCGGNLFLHKPISDVCDWARASWGFPAYNLATLIAIPVLSVVVALPRLLRPEVAFFERRTLVPLFSLIVMSVAAQRWLLVANVELIHFPQFALLSVALLAAGLGAEVAWLLATFAGILDEFYQHLVIYAGRTDTYLDFNDMLLNAIGAGFGVLLFARVEATSTQRSRIRWRVALGFLSLSLPVALWWDPPWLRPLLRPSPGANPYRVLSPAEALLCATLIWGMVLISKSETAEPEIQSSKLSRPAPRRPSVLCFWILAAIISVLSAGCSLGGRTAVPQPPPRASETPPTPFIITFWCGPPLPVFSGARAGQIAAAGFNVVGPPCEGARSQELNRWALDVAARNGLRLWVADPRYNPSVLEHADWRERVAAAVAAYRNHPALDGYFVIDEPPASMFTEVAAVTNALHEEDVTRPAYVNLLPSYIPWQGLGTATYEDYVDDFIDAVQPRLLSYDYYAFRNDNDRTTFFENLSLIRQRALARHVPFLLIVLAMPHGPYRDPTEGELAWQLFHAIAYGARGVSYFAYWTPVKVAHADLQKFRNGLIENGRPTPRYFQAKRLNPLLRAIGDELESFRSVAVADSLAAIAPAFPLGPLAAIEGGPVTAGLFADHGGTQAMLLVNRDYRKPVSAQLRLGQGAPLPEVFDAARRRWVRLARPTLALAPGHGRLLRWKVGARPEAPANNFASAARP